MRFRGVLAVEGQETSDGRLIERGALTWPDDPIPVHLGFGGPIIGRAENIARVGDEIVCEIELPDRVEDAFGLAVGITVVAGEAEGEQLYRVTQGTITQAAATDKPAFATARAELIDTPEDRWRRVGDAVKALAADEDIVRHALALRARVIDPSGNEDDVDLSASLSALVVREFDALSGVARDEPASVVVRFVLPRGWWSAE